MTLYRTNDDQCAQEGQERIERRRRELGISDPGHEQAERIDASCLAQAQPVVPADSYVQEVAPLSSCYTRDTDTHETQEIQETDEPQETHDTQDSLETERKRKCIIQDDAVVEDSPSTTQPLDAYLLAAARDAQWRLDNREYDDPWMTALWHFTRLVKGHPELEGLAAMEAMERIEPVLTQYAETESSVDLEDPFEVICNDYDSGSRLEFLTTWDKVRYAPGWSLLRYVEEQALTHPYTPQICRDGKMLEYARFVSFAGWLQVGVGNRPVMLPCKAVSELGLFNTNKMMVSRLRQLAVGNGDLVVAREHCFHPAMKDRKATEFRFNIAVDPVFLEEAAEGCAEAFEMARKQNNNSREAYDGSITKWREWP